MLSDPRRRLSPRFFHQRRHTSTYLAIVTSIDVRRRFRAAPPTIRNSSLKKLMSCPASNPTSELFAPFRPETLVGVTCSYHHTSLSCLAPIRLGTIVGMTAKSGQEAVRCHHEQYAFLCWGCQALITLQVQYETTLSPTSSQDHMPSTGSSY